MIQKGSRAYQILEIVSMTGEVGEDAVTILIPQADYRKKLLQRLLQENKIVRYQKDGLKGYRLTISGKRWMLQCHAERFAYFLENGADATMRRSDFSHRSRQHRLAAVMSLFYLAGIEIFHDQKPEIFQPCERIIRLRRSAFYSSMEWKNMGSLSTKIISSRAAGIWLTECAVWFCYHLQGIHTWYGNIEKRADVVVRSLLQQHEYFFTSTRALLFYDSETFGALEPKQYAHIRESPFEKFCYIPLDEKGSIVLQLLDDIERYQYLYQVLTEDLEKSEDNTMIHDGYNDRKEPVLVCFDLDLKKLILFHLQLKYAERTGEVICFDFQKEEVEKICDAGIKVSTVDLEAVRELFF